MTCCCKSHQHFAPVTVLQWPQQAQSEVTSHHCSDTAVLANICNVDLAPVSRLCFDSCSAQGCPSYLMDRE